MQYIMDRGIITISEAGMVTIPTAPVWMTQFEIADLFGVFSCDIRKAIHAIYRNKELNECDTIKYIKQPDGISYDVYNPLNPQLHSRSATYIKRNGLLIRKITIKSSRPFQCAYHPLTP